MVVQGYAEAGCGAARMLVILLSYPKYCSVTLVYLCTIHYRQALLPALTQPTSPAAFHDLRTAAMATNYFANPPPGLDLSESRTATNNAVGIILFTLSAVFVGLRLLTRVKLKRERLGVDDYLMFLGLALNAGNLACCIAG